MIATLVHAGSLIRSHLKEYARWRRPPLRLHAPGPAGVFYGYDTVPARDEVVIGGLVKLQDLDPVFPNTPRGAALLYLISSALPPAVSTMVRRATAHGVKLVLNQNGIAYPGWQRDRWRETNRPLAHVLRHADHVVYQSRFCKESADVFLGKAPAGWEILYNPVDTRRFVPAAPGSATDQIRVLVAGTHWEWYRVQTALDAISHVLRTMPEVRLTIAGRFRWRPRPEAAAAEAREYARAKGVLPFVTFHGAYSQNEALPLLQAAHILLHTKYLDPCPRLVVEAMACGLPVVYSATGGVPELVGDEAGIGIAGPLDYEDNHPPDAGRMAEAVCRVAGQLPAYAAAARERAERRFDVKPWLGRHAEIFSGLLEDR